jgi:small subunit ribosomal protein S17
MAKLIEKKEAKRKTKQGIVTKVVDTKTVKVEVENKKAHPLYGKIIKSHKRYLVDANGKTVTVGDKVIIEECSPISKNKKFKLIK